MSLFIPDPEITMEEAITAMAAIQHATVVQERWQNDAVLAAFHDKIRGAAHALQRQYPDEFDDTSRRIEMRRRLGGE